MKYPDLVRGELNYTAVAISRYRCLPGELRLMLEDSGRREDVVAWLFVAALESYQAGEDFGAARRRANRRLYHALKAEGFRRDPAQGMMYIRNEIPRSRVERRESG